MISPEDSEIVFALIEGVMNAMPQKGSERDVTTLITLPLWKKWCAIHGDPPDTVPTDWMGKNTKRIYGSYTVVVEGDTLRDISFSHVTYPPKLYTPR